MENESMSPFHSNSSQCHTPTHCSLHGSCPSFTSLLRLALVTRPLFIQPQQKTTRSRLLRCSCMPALPTRACTYPKTWHRFVFLISTAALLTRLRPMWVMQCALAGRCDIHFTPRMVYTASQPLCLHNECLILLYRLEMFVYL